MANNYLVADLGTGNSRVALVSSDGQIIDLESFENVYQKDPLYDDAQFFNPQDWRKKIIDATKKVVSRNKDKKIQGITSSGARQTIVCYDANGVDFYGLPNIDNRGAKWMDEIPDKAYIYEKTGHWCTEDFPAAKLMGFRKLHKDEFSKIVKITSLSEWIGEIFTGEIAIEPSQACETQLYDIDEKKWSEKICGYYKIPMNMLPKVMKAGESLGKVKKDVAEECGLTTDCEFIIGGADTQIACKSMNVNVGDICVVSGTTSPVVTIVDKKYYDVKERCWCDVNLGGDTFQIECNPGVTGNNWQRFKKMMFPDMSYDEVGDKICAKKDFVCTASFSSLNFAHKKSFRHGGFVMRAPFSQTMDRIDMGLAMLGDITCSIYTQYRNLCEMIPNNKDYIIGCGGGFHQPFLCQNLATLTGKELRIYKGFDQAAALGGARVCNDYFGISNDVSVESAKKYEPSKDPDALIQRYYEQWAKNRAKLNP